MVNEIVQQIMNNINENDIDSILSGYYELHRVKKEFDAEEEKLRDKIKILLKENKWNNYKSPHNKLSVTITTQQREKINKESLKLLLNEEQYSQVVSKTSFEKMLIVTPEDRKRLKKYGR